MDRILMILKKKLTLPWSYIHTCIHMNIIVKQIYWYISQISGERLLDHWSSGYIGCLILACDVNQFYSHDVDIIGHGIVRTISFCFYNMVAWYNIYVFIGIALDESICLDVLHFPMKNIKSCDLEVMPMDRGDFKTSQLRLFTLIAMMLSAKF